MNPRAAESEPSARAPQITPAVPSEPPVFSHGTPPIQAMLESQILVLFRKPDAPMQAALPGGSVCSTGHQEIDSNLTSHSEVTPPQRSGIRTARLRLQGVRADMRFGKIQIIARAEGRHFESGGAPDLYLGSADWMPRNRYERVEVMFPVKDAGQRERVTGILLHYLKDTAKSRMLHAMANIFAPSRAKLPG